MGLTKFDRDWEERAAKASRALWNLKELARWAGIREPNTAYKWAERLTKAKRLVRIAKGFYALPYRPPEAFEIASTLYAPSYVSTESALAFHGVLSQAPRAVTSLTPRKSRRLAARGLAFEYAHCPPRWFLGFDSREGAAVATPEKALIDCWYLRRPPHREDLDLSRLNQGRLAHWVALLNHPRVRRAWSAWSRA